MWSPSDRSLAYASHVQVATEEQGNEEEENEALQDDSGTVRVASLEGSKLMPMQIGNSYCRVCS